MIIRNKKTFSLGVVFTVSFLGVLLLIFSPLFGGKNGLRFSDDSFNKLSKGSSYFIPKVAKSVERLSSKQVSAKIKFDNPEDAALSARILETAGATVGLNETELQIDGALGAILGSALKDADAMYNNDGKVVSDRYGHDEKKAMKIWWASLSKMEKNLKKVKSVEEAKVISEVNKKAIEPAYNFYKVDANKVSEHAGMMTGLLVFYVAYTMWWGFAIYYIFEGIGLTMKKARVKKEA